MRLWSLHPKYLDSKGLVALWREGLLAKAVLEGKTKGYKNHPQLERFKSHSKPVKAINNYLYCVVLEAEERGYNFDKTKVKSFKLEENILVTDKQVKYEFNHLLKKLKKRDKDKHKEISNLKKIEPHPIIKIKAGPVEKWEKVLD